MQEKSLIKKNILKFLDSKGISKYEFYKQTGITRGILDQNNGMSEENTARFLAVYGKEVSADCLFNVTDKINTQCQNNSPPVSYKEPIASIDLLKETDIRILAMNETIETQKRYINHLEKENEKLSAQLENFVPDEVGQKRKAG